MVKDKHLTVIIPAYNEERFIQKVILGLPIWVDEIVCVDDGSVDQTPQQIRDCKDSRVKLLQHHARRGVGAAIATGFAYAMKSKTELIATIDADDQMNPQDILNLIKGMDDKKVGWAKGNRFEDPKVRQIMPIMRYIGNRCLTAVQNWALRGVIVKDAQCGLTVWRRSTLQKMDLKNLWEGYGVYNDLLYRAVKAGAYPVNVQAATRYGSEKSHIQGCKVVPNILKMLLLQRKRFSKHIRKQGILVLTSTYPLSESDGAGDFVRQWARELSGTGKFITILAPHARHSRLQESDLAGFRVRRFRYFLPTKYQGLAYGHGIIGNLKKKPLLLFQIPLYFISCLWATLWASRNHRWIHAHWLIPSGVIALIMNIFFKKKIVMTAHSADLNIINKIKIGPLLARIMIRRSATVTVVSQWGYELLVKWARSQDKCKIKHIPMGCVACPDHFIEPIPVRQKLSLGYMGRLVEPKGIERVIRMLSENQWHSCLHIAGDGPMLQKWKKLCDSLGVKAVFYGSLVGRDKINFWKKVDVAIFPSHSGSNDQPEGCPVSLIEAMRAGKVIVAARSGGIGELIQDEYNGILIQGHSIEALQDAFKRLLNHRFQFNSWRIKAIQMGKMLEWPKLTPLYSGLYQ